MGLIGLQHVWIQISIHWFTTRFHVIESIFYNVITDKATVCVGLFLV